MNAIAYLRLSSRDQSKSLQYQESTIRDYCRRNNLEVTAVFTDNGEDSYTFDRPNYKALENFVKKYKGKCQYLIVLDHDRFSRNLPEALTKIAELERTHGVKVLSTNERIDLDTSDPDVFMKRAFDYMIANKELFTIRSRTKQGIRNAKENGRYLGRAPYGYRNILDGSRRNLIEINPTQAPIVQRVFRDYLLGVAPYIIFRNVKALGFHHTGTNAIFDILNQPLHAGLIRVPAFKDLPEKFVKGLHKPIVSEAEYWTAQKMLSQKRPMKVRADEEFPLRGVLKCMCGSPFTAGWSKGAKEYYLYYRCVKHSNINIPGSRLHEEFNKILKALSFQPEQIAFLQDGVIALSKIPMKQKHQQTTEKMLALKEVNDKIMQLEERYMNNEVETSTYKTWFKKLTEEKSELELAMKPRFRQNECAEKSIGRTLPHLKNLFQIFELCNIYQKHAIVRALFKDNLAYGGGMFRTNFIDPTFIANAL